MNSNLFDRKNFLEGNWMTTNLTEYFTTKILDENTIVKVNLLRATANESDSLKKYLTQIPSNKIKSLIIDFSNSNFIDSTFLSSIISYNKSTHVQIKLVVADTRQLTLLKITKIDSLFRIYSSLNLALTA